MTLKEIENRLSQFYDPYLQRTFGSVQAIKKVDLYENKIKIAISLGYPIETIKQSLLESLFNWLAPILGNLLIEVSFTTKIDAHSGNQNLATLKNVKNIIAVASGKGGVGKSMLATQLALGLFRAGAQTGILDADIYGPSQPMMFDALTIKPIFANNKWQPVNRYGIQTMSMGYLVEQDAPMIWRGPMIAKAMQQLLQDTLWENLDYLVIDLPPGTGDVQLTLCQKIPVSGAVMITTPQDLALADVKRACAMFNKLNVPLLGVVENMSIYKCRQCGHTEKIFGEGGACKLAQDFDVELLEQVPLNLKIRELTDSGNLHAIETADNEFVDLFNTIALKIAAKLSLAPKSYSALFPKIVRG